MVDDPAGFAWSSVAALCGLGTDALLTERPAYRALGTSSAERAQAYRRLLEEAVSDDELLAIRQYLQQQRAWKRDDFRAMVEAKTRRFAGVRAPHRPAKPLGAEK